MSSSNDPNRDKGKEPLTGRDNRQPDSKQSSEPQQHPIDVEHNLEDQPAQESSQIPVHRGDPSPKIVLPLKKRPLKDIYAASSGTPMPEVADKGGSPAETPDSATKKKREVGGVERSGSGGKKSPAETPESATKRDREVGGVEGGGSGGNNSPAETPDSATKRKREVGGVEWSGSGGKKEAGHKVERKYGSGSKTGSLGKQQMDRDSEVDKKGTRTVGYDSGAGPQTRLAQSRRRLFDKSTNIEGASRVTPERAPLQRPSLQTPPNKSAEVKSGHGDRDSRKSSGSRKATISPIEFDEDLDLTPPIRKSSSSSSPKRAVVPEPMPMDFVVQPRSNVNPEVVEANRKRAAEAKKGPRHRVLKRLEQMRRRNRKK